MQPTRNLRAPRCRLLLALALTLSAGALLPPSAQAVLPPQPFTRLQQFAPELLQIEVTAVRQDKQSESKDLKVIAVTVQARVLAVQRTATRLKAGAHIAISYEDVRLKHAGVTGEGVISPLLTKGERCPAYLQRRADQPAFYELAAGAYTFKKYKE